MSQHRSSRRRNVEEEEPMDYECSQASTIPSTPTATQSASQASTQKQGRKSSKIQMTDAVRDGKVDAVVRYLLTAGPVVRRVDIVKFAIGTEHSRFYKEIFELAKQKLTFLFMIEIMENANKHGTYYLVNSLPNVDFLKPNDGKTDARNGLLYIILSVIYMTNPTEKVITENELCDFLSKLDVDINCSHRVFGDVKKLLTKTFTDEGWLEYRRDKSDEEDAESTFAWGARALLAIRRSDVMTMVADVMFNDRTRSKIWREHAVVAEQEDAVVQVLE